MKKATLFIFSFLLLAHAAFAQRFRSKDIQTALDTASALQQSFTGFVLYDPQSDRTIFEQYADKYMTPASNTKLYTFYTAQKMLGDSLPALAYHLTADSLIFWGTGYPLFLHPDFSDATIERFFQQHADKKIFYREVPTKEERFGPGWSWSDFAYYYSTEKSTFPIYGNHLRLRHQGHEDSLEVHPKLLQKYFTKDYAPPQEAWRIANRAETANAFTYYPTLDTDPKPQETWIPFRYSTQVFIALLEDALKQKVYKYQGDKPQTKQVLYNTQADTVYRLMLQQSDNFLAEQILMMCASTLGDTLDTEKAIEYAKEQFMSEFPAEPEWVDGSGLSRYNMFTPRTTVALLQKIKQTVGEEKIQSLFPAGGVSGTIRNWYAHPENPDKPYVFAKTGTLSNNHCLSGLLYTKSGKVLIFSFMHNHYTVYSSQVKQHMERILNYVRVRY